MLKKIAVLISGLVIGFIIIEIVCRIFFADRSIVLPVYRLDKEIGPVLKPNIKMNKISSEFNTTINTNSMGFRGPEWDLKFKGKKIIGFGDSFTFGSGVAEDETFLNIMEKYLNNKYKVKVYNAGQPASGTYNQYLIAKRIVPLLKPDIIIVNFFTGNDFTDNYYGNKRYTCNSKGYLITNTRKTFLSYLKNNIFIHFYSLRIISEQLSHIPVFYYFYHKSTLKAGSADQILFFTDSEKPAASKAFDNTCRYLLDFKKYAESFKSKFYVVLIPDKLQVNDKKWDKNKKIMFKTGGLNPNRYYYYQKIIKFIKNNDITYISLYERLHNAYLSGEKLYYNMDPHWTSNGHKIAGETIAKTILGN